MNKDLDARIQAEFKRNADYQASIGNTKPQPGSSMQKSKKSHPSNPRSEYLAAQGKSAKQKEPALTVVDNSQKAEAIVDNTWQSKAKRGLKKAQPYLIGAALGIVAVGGIYLAVRSGKKVPVTAAVKEILATYQAVQLEGDAKALVVSRNRETPEEMLPIIDVLKKAPGTVLVSQDGKRAWGLFHTLLWKIGPNAFTDPESSLLNPKTLSDSVISFMMGEADETEEPTKEEVTV